MIILIASIILNYRGCNKKKPPSLNTNSLEVQVQPQSYLNTNAGLILLTICSANRLQHCEAGDGPRLAQH